MRAPARRGALGNQLTHDFIGEPILGLAQRSDVDPDALQHGRGIHTKLPQQVWNRQEWCNRYVLGRVHRALSQCIRWRFDSRVLRHNARLG